MIRTESCGPRIQTIGPPSDQGHTHETVVTVPCSAMAETGVAMRCLALWRCVRNLAVLLLVAFYAGHASGQTPAKCFAAARTPASAATTQRVAAASETRIWKTITVGGSKGVNAVRVAMEVAPCPVVIGDDADEILGRPAFPFGRKLVELDLVVVSVFELGLGDQSSRNDVELASAVEVSLRDVYARAIALGFELCPAEVGPALRLQYLDQPLGEFLRIAMTPVARYTGELVDFTLGNGGAGLMLVGGNGDPAATVPSAVRFVFVRPRADSIARGKPPANGEDVAKR